jgi:hypothetical protein
MIRVTEVREKRLSILSTYVATLSPVGPREYYLAQETERLLEAVLTRLMEGDRESTRAFYCALYLEFLRELPFGRLHEVRSYQRDRRIHFELEQGALTRLAIFHSRNSKEIVRLGIEEGYLLGDVVAHISLPARPFSFKPSY